MSLAALQHVFRTMEETYSMSVNTHLCFMFREIQNTMWVQFEYNFQSITLHNAMQYINFSNSTTFFHFFAHISRTIYSSVNHKLQYYIGTDKHNKNTTFS
jgi:hypothetical protein